MKKPAVKKLTLNKETLRNLDEKTLERIMAGNLCPTLHCTDPAYTCPSENGLD